MKICFKCQNKKPLSEFYKHSAMTDGRLGKCKDCTKSDVREHRLNNIDKVRRYDRNRPNAVDRTKRFLVAHKERLKDDDYKERTNKHKREHYRRNKEKKAANVLLKRAVDRGDMERPINCPICGSGERTIHGHHDDYTKPLDVTWCCPKCHGEIHKDINRKNRNTSQTT